MEQGPIHKIKNNITINFVLFLLFILLMQALYDHSIFFSKSSVSVDRVNSPKGSFIFTLKTWSFGLGQR
jgi:hypothetical protein